MIKFTKDIEALAEDNEDEFRLFMHRLAKLSICIELLKTEQMLNNISQELDLETMEAMQDPGAKA